MMFKHSLHSQLSQINAKHETDDNTAYYKLDKNEHVVDLEKKLKAEILKGLSERKWNRYPSMDYGDIEEKLSEYCHLENGEVVVAPGAASILAALLNYFAINELKINIIQPSYAFLNYHCNTFNIPFYSWWLNDKLEYDLANFPKLNEHSALILTSPNNPTGNVLGLNELRKILQKYPESIIVLDAVYQEYGQIDYTPLVAEFDNLILIRSFSKAFPAAGIRLGYLCAQKKLAHLVRKLILPYSINHFSLEFASVLLNNPVFLDIEKHKIQQVIINRDQFFKKLKSTFSSEQLIVYPSQGNFLLIKVIADDNFIKLNDLLTQNGIKILDTSKQAMLSNTIRLSVGHKQEMEAVFNCIKKTFNVKIKTMQLRNDVIKQNTEFVYKKDNVNIRYIDKYSLLVQTWTKFIKSEDFRKAIDFTTDFVTENPVNYIISDALKQAAIRPDDSTYAASVMPKLVECGLKAFAFVIPEDIFTKLSLKKFSDMENTDQVQYFWDFEEALAWINKVRGRV